MLLDSNNVRLLNDDYLDKCFVLNTIAEYCCNVEGIAHVVVTNSSGWFDQQLDGSKSFQTERDSICYRRYFDDPIGYALLLEYGFP